MESVALFCDMDDFGVGVKPVWPQRLVSEGSSQPPWTSRLWGSEVMTIVVSFHQSG